MSSLTVTLADAANLDQVKNIRLKSSACFPVVVTCVRGSFNLSNANPTRTLRFTSDGWTTDAPITYDSFYAATQKQLVTSAAESLVRSGFGYSIAISGNGLNAVIGTNVLNFSVGGARIYTRSTVTDTWTYQANVLGTGAASWALQGASCDISYDGNTVIVGGTAADSWAGALWIFTRTGTTWSQLGDKLVGTDAIGAANQGTSIAISADGQYIASGGIEDNSGVGAVWVFKYDGQGYSQYGDKIIGTGSTGAAHQGRSVSLSNDGTYLAFGGDANDASHGATWLYVNLNGSFSEQYEGPMVGTGYINAPHQGYSIKLSAAGNTLVVGGYGDDTNTGAVWIWTRTGSTWTQMGSKLIGTDAVGAAKQGYSVSITSDGNTIAVLGTTNNTNAGAIWRWSRSGDKWIQQGTYLIPSTVITTLSTITMSASGKELILGAMNGGGADYTGQIYYFN
jgi:hypothetical protein